MQFVKGILVFLPEPDRFLAQIGTFVRFRTRGAAFWHSSALLSDSAMGIKPVLSTYKQSTSGNAKQLLSTWVFGFAKSDKSADLCHI